VGLVLSSFAVPAEEVEITAEVAKLLASDGAASDFFGNSVSLDGDRLAIGAYLDAHSNEQNAGSVYVFERGVDGEWFAASKLLLVDAKKFDNFGVSVSLDGDRLAIGMTGDDDNGVDSGSVYVFERDANGSWFQVSKLLPTDGAAGDRFGIEVSLDGERLAIGAHQDDDNGSFSGSAYVFEHRGKGAWLEVSKLLPPDGQWGDRFGISVSLDGDRLAVGAHEDDDNGTESGSAYVFDRDDDGDWFIVGKLLPLGAQPNDHFGFSVSLDEDRVAIGAYQDDPRRPGSAYVFERDQDGNWFEIGKLLSLDGRRGDQFGISVSLDGDRLAIGANQRNESGSDSGSAYLFERDEEGGWFEVNELSPLDGQKDDHFGSVVSLDGDRLAIGASGDDRENAVFNSGSAYVFEPVVVSPELTIRGTCPGEVQLTSDGTTPRSGVRTYASATPGVWSFDGGPCKGTLLDLDQPTLLGQALTDFDPKWSRTRVLDASQCRTYLQLIDLRTCLTSEVVQVP